MGRQEGGDQRESGSRRDAQHFGEKRRTGTVAVGSGERGSHLFLEHQMRLTSMRTKTINRNPTTAARPTSQGFGRYCEAVRR